MGPPNTHGGPRPGAGRKAGQPAKYRAQNPHRRQSITIRLPADIIQYLSEFGRSKAREIEAALRERMGERWSG